MFLQKFRLHTSRIMSASKVPTLKYSNFKPLVEEIRIPTQFGFISGRLIRNFLLDFFLFLLTMSFRKFVY